jgi:hypothetical protein
MGGHSGHRTWLLRFGLTIGNAIGNLEEIILNDELAPREVVGGMV